MPTLNFIATIGTIIILAILIIFRNRKRKAQINSINAGKFNCFTEQLMRENTEIRKDLQAVRKKIEEIDVIMKDI